MSQLERQLEASISLTRQSRAAKGLKDAWARYQRAISARAKYAHTSAPTADLEVTRSAEAFAEIAAAALGLDSNVVPLRATISDEDRE